MIDPEDLRCAQKRSDDLVNSMNPKASSRGGARKGAGRKPAPKRDLKAITVRIDRETAEGLAEYCKFYGISVTQWVERQAKHSMKSRPEISIL